MLRLGGAAAIAARTARWRVKVGAAGSALRCASAEAARMKELDELPLVMKGSESSALLKEASPLQWSSTRILCMEERYLEARQQFEQSPSPDAALALARAYEEFNYGTTSDRRHLYEKVVKAAREGSLLEGSMEEAFFDQMSDHLGRTGKTSERLLEDMESINMQLDGSFFWKELDQQPTHKVAPVFLRLAKRLPESLKGPSVLREILSRTAEGGDVESSMELLGQLQEQGHWADTKTTLRRLVRRAGETHSPRDAKRLAEFINKQPPTVKASMLKQQIGMHGMCGDLPAAQALFARARATVPPHLKMSLYVTYLTTLGFHRRGDLASEILAEFDEQPSQSMLAAVLNALVYSGMHEAADDLLNNIEDRYGVEPIDRMQNLLIDSIALQGDLERLRFTEKSLRSSGKLDAATNGSGMRHLQRAYAALGATKDVIRVSKAACKESRHDANPFRIWMRAAASLPETDRQVAMQSVWVFAAIRLLPLLDSPAYLDGHHDPITSGQLPAYMDEEKIKRELQIQEEELAAASYVPTRSLVDYEMFEEATEAGQPCRHSERIALAYALMQTDSKDEIFIHKPHLMCDDCHTAIRLLSKIRQRDIVVMTSGRLHRFTNGSCNCGDHPMY